MMEFYFKVSTKPVCVYVCVYVGTRLQSLGLLCVFIYLLCLALVFVCMLSTAGHSKCPAAHVVKILGLVAETSVRLLPGRRVLFISLFFFLLVRNPTNEESNFFFRLVFYFILFLKTGEC